MTETKECFKIKNALATNAKDNTTSSLENIQESKRHKTSNSCTKWQDPNSSEIVSNLEKANSTRLHFIKNKKYSQQFKPTTSRNDQT